MVGIPRRKGSSWLWLALYSRHSTLAFPLLAFALTELKFHMYALSFSGFFFQEICTTLLSWNDELSTKHFFAIRSFGHSVIPVLIHKWERISANCRERRGRGVAREALESCSRGEAILRVAHAPENRTGCARFHQPQEHHQFETWPWFPSPFWFPFPLSFSSDS